MRGAPAVQVVVARQLAWPALQSALYALTAMLLSAWLGQRAGLAGAATLGLAAVAGLAAGGVVLWWCRSGPAQELRWDGAAWQFLTVAGAPAPLSGQVAVMVDLGGWMLLRFQAAAGRPVAWLPVSQRQSVAAWHGLRAALFTARPAPSLRR